MAKKLIAICLLALLAAGLYAGEMSMNLQTSLDLLATTSWGYNIDTGATGFSTVINWLELKFTPTGYGTTESLPPEKAGEPYTLFSVTGLDMTIISTASGHGFSNENNTKFTGVNFNNMAIKLMLPPSFWVGLYVFDSMENGDVNIFEDFSSDRALIGSRTTYRALQDGGMAENASLAGTSRNLFTASYSPRGHVLIGFDHPVIDIIGKIGSRYDWTNAVPEGEAANQEYAFGAQAWLKLIPGLHLSLDGYGTTYIDSDGDPMFSIKTAYDIPIYKTLFLQPFVSFDGQLTLDGMNMEVAGGINIPWDGSGYQVDPIRILEGGNPAVTGHNNRFKKDNTYAGLTLGASFYFPDDGSDPASLIDLSIFEAQGDAGLYQDLGLVLTLQVYNLLGTIEYGAAGYVDFELFDDSFRPMLAVKYQNYDQIDYALAVDNLDVHVGVHYIKIPNATIGVEYDTGNLLLEAEPVLGNIYTFLALSY